MYLGNKVDLARLEETQKLYAETLPHPNETLSAYFHLDHLEAFVKDARRIADAKGQSSVNVGLLLLRGGLQKDDTAYEIVQHDQLQINIALVIKDDKETFVLEPGGESSGLCPKNCGKMFI